MTPEEQAAAFQARVNSTLSEQGIVDPAAATAVATAYRQKFESWEHHRDMPDGMFSAVLGGIVRGSPELVLGKPAEEPSPDFFRYLAEAKNLTPQEYETLHPKKKLAYANEFKASQSPGTSPDETLIQHFKAKYGNDLDAAKSRMTALDRARLDDARRGVSNHQRHARTADGGTETRLSHSPVIASMTGQQKLSFANDRAAADRLSREIAGLRASASTDYFVESDRSRRIARLEAERNAIVRRYPGLIPTNA